MTGNKTPKQLARKKRKPNVRRYYVGPEHTYWPVTETDGTVIALCPSMSVAQAIAAALHKGNAHE